MVLKGLFLLRMSKKRERKEIEVGLQYVQNDNPNGHHLISV